MQDLRISIFSALSSNFHSIDLSATVKQMLFRFRLSIENVDNYAALPAEIPITFISVVGGKVELLLCQRVIKCT